MKPLCADTVSSVFVRNKNQRERDSVHLWGATGYQDGPMYLYPAIYRLSLVCAYTRLAMLRLRTLSQTTCFLKTTLWTKCNLVDAWLSSYKRYCSLSWELAWSNHIAFNSQRPCSNSPQIFWNLRAKRAIGGPRVITIGPWDPRAHFRNRFWCMFVYWELHHVNARQVVGASMRDLVPWKL